ncbi:MAG TPA: DoxX family protein [bacterium]|nr:DoxX family protein [bacterium]
MRIGTVLLRLGPAVVFLLHGYLKLWGGEHDRTVALFLTVNLPQPELLAWFIGTLEFLGGVALLSGMLMRPFAALLALEMAVAIYRVRLPQGFIGGWEFELTLLFVCLGLALASPWRPAAGT